MPYSKPQKIDNQPHLVNIIAENVFMKINKYKSDMQGIKIEGMSKDNS